MPHLSISSQPNTNSNETVAVPVSPLLVAGEHVLTPETFDVVNPYDGSLAGKVALASEDDVLAAVTRMSGPAPRLSRHQRATILRKMAAIIASRKDQLARLASRESGLSLKDTGYEMARAVDALNLAADATTFDDGGAFAGDIGATGKPRRIFSHREPVGLIAAITPFNHPLNQVVAKVAPAIAANAPIIVKPSEKTPLSALALGAIAYEAGLPCELLSIVAGDPKMVARVFASHPAIKLLTFTGSPRVGKLLLKMADYRRVVMELGGNDPLIVFPDADIERAATLAAAGAFGNSGQRCTAVKRILAHESIADEFADALAAKARALRVGNPLDPDTDVGTVIDEAAAMAIEARFVSAAASGAHVLVPLRREGALISPCVIDHVAPEAALVVEETFGPVAPIIRFRNIDEAIRISNSTAYGLSAGLCTDRLDWITRCVAELQVGGINVWEVPGYRSELSPFGGVKDSGLGQKEGMLEAIKLYTNTKTVSYPWF